MWKKWKESKLCKKLKQVRVNRAIYISAIVILLSLAIVLAITAATNRAKKNNATTPSVSGGVTDQITEPSDTPTSPEKKDPLPTVSNTVPEMAAPVSGKLSKVHSAEVQVFSQTLQEYRVHLGIDI